MRIQAHKIASVTRNLKLNTTLTLSPEILLEEGSVLACRVHGEKTRYNQLEDPHGRMSTLHDGDIVVGALGRRHALQGYEGVMPESLAVGDTLHMLNMGGVMGRCVSYNPDVGTPFELEVLGQVLAFPDFGSRTGVPAHVRLGAHKGAARSASCPVVYIAGTCMNAGKTAAACAIVRSLSRAGLKVGGTKLTGISLMRDVLSMKDHGAALTLDFTDAGVVCSGPESAPQAARIIFSELAAAGVDVIVAETGDGILGEYGVQAILADPELTGLAAAFVLCANDPVGVAGGVRHMQEAFGLKVDLVAGPATDNAVGSRFVESLGLVARNARSNPKGLGDFILNKLEVKV